MSRARDWLAVGALCYLLFLVIQAPAGLLAWGVQRGSGGALALDAVAGSVWRGSARRIVWHDGGQAQELGGLHWSWRPADLMQGRIGVGFSLHRGPGAELSGRLAAGPGSFSLHELAGELPAQLLGSLYRPLGLIQPQGRVAVSLREAALDGARIRAQASLTWLDAASALVPGRLGEYRLRLATPPAGDTLALNVETLRGPLLVNGDGSYRPGAGGSFNLLMSPPAGQRDAYAPALNLLTAPGTDGNYRLSVNL